MIKLKKRGIIYIFAFFVLQVIKIGMLNFFEDIYPEGRIAFYPQVEQVYDCYTFQEMNSEHTQVYLGTSKEMAHVERQEDQEVKIMGVNYKYPFLEPIHLVAGRFWQEQAQREGRNVVVISKNLASTFFNSYEVLGKTIQLGEAIYLIVGVYEKPNDLFHTLTDFGDEVVYVPLTSSLGKKINVKSIWFEKLTDTKAVNLSSGTFYQANDAIKRLTSITWVSINLLLMVFILFLLKRCIDVAFFTSQQTTKEKTKELLIYGGIILIMGKCFMLHIDIPSEVLPPYNIFDLTYYWKYFIEKLTLHYQMIKLSETAFEPMYWLITKWGLMITVIQLVLCFPIAKGVVGRRP